MAAFLGRERSPSIADANGSRESFVARYGAAGPKPFRPLFLTRFEVVSKAPLPLYSGGEGLGVRG